MSVRVLIVDDSGFFRRRLTEILDADPLIEVVDVAVDGKQAIEKARRVKPDVITMDIEMPVMNGIDATREIMKTTPVPILMFSSLTYDGAQATLDALEAGATDFLPKRFDDISNDRDEARQILTSRVKLLARGNRMSRPAPTTGQAAISGQAVARPGAESVPVAPRPARKAKAFNPTDFDILGIGCSTGGPVALQALLTQLPANFALPIVMVQHMPAKFTEAFANRLNSLCKIQVKEAADGDVLEPGTALLAPGGMQMEVSRRGGRLVVRVREETDPMQHYKPCVDITFNSLAVATGSRTLGVILTGMGADGKVASNRLKSSGATIWAQDQATSTIYGMPAAVADIADQILPINDIGKKLALNS